MRRVVVLAEAAEDLEEARRFYEASDAGVDDYCVTSLLADIESLGIYHGVHRRQHGCFRMLASRFPFRIYYLEGQHDTRIVAVLDLRREPSWIRARVTRR
jgi:plasmid stabilization system protein ParE